MSNKSLDDGLGSGEISQKKTLEENDLNSKVGEISSSLSSLSISAASQIIKQEDLCKTVELSGFFDNNESGDISKYMQKSCRKDMFVINKDGSHVYVTFKTIDMAKKFLETFNDPVIQCEMLINTRRMVSVKPLPRPEKTPIVAARLISRSLGVGMPSTPRFKEQERRLLDAKEQKRLEKERKDTRRKEIDDISRDCDSSL